MSLSLSTPQFEKHRVGMVYNYREYRVVQDLADLRFVVIKV